MFSPRKALAFALALVSVAANANDGEYLQGKVIVKYKNGATRDRHVLNKMYEAAGMSDVERFQGMMENLEVITLEDGVKVEDAIAEIQRNEEVEYAQPDYILQIQPVTAFNPNPDAAETEGTASGAPCLSVLLQPECAVNRRKPKQPPNRPKISAIPKEVIPSVTDPDLSKAYGLAKIGATSAWKGMRGNKKIIVGVIDTGIDYNHEDLAFNLWRNPNPTQGDLIGFDFVYNDGMPFDDHGHGTHTAGTVGATGGNGIGISGVAQRVSLMTLKFLSADGKGGTSAAVKAINYGVNNGAKILSNSWGGPSFWPLNRALREAVVNSEAKGVLFVAAAGNSRKDLDRNWIKDYPAAFMYDNMITVAATDENDRMAFFSSYGQRRVHLAAPGVDVYSTVPGNQYTAHSGTSMACPHVAGAAALVWAKNPTWNYKQVKSALLKSVDPIESLKTKTVTGGRLNVLRALNTAP